MNIVRLVASVAAAILLTGQVAATPDLSLAALEPIAPAEVGIVFGRAIANRRSGEQEITATVSNLGAAVTGAGVLVAVEGITPDGVTVSNADAVSTEGVAYYALDPADFALGESVDLRIHFADAGRLRLDYALALYRLPPLPRAAAGPDRNALAAGQAELDGSASYDPDGDPITFAWTLVTKPAGSAAVLSDPVSPTPRFALDRPGAYVFSLTVSDGVFTSAADTVTIRAVADTAPPNADAGPDRTQTFGTVVQLDGHASNDPNLMTLAYAWRLISVPERSALLTQPLTPDDAAMTSFVPDQPGQYRALLEVDNGHASDSDTVEVTIVSGQPNAAPTADAGPSKSVAAGEPVIVDGTLSGDSDAGPQPLSFRWSVVSRPPGSTVNAGSFADAGTATPAFVPDVAGDYIVRVEVSDGAATASDHTFVHADGCARGPQALTEFSRVNASGYGDKKNSFSWSGTKFGEDMFFGTNRQFTCLEAATLQFFFPQEAIYPAGLPDPAVTCPPNQFDLDLGAEIWKMSKATGTWTRVFKSPRDLPIPGQQDKWAAPDVGFRGMTVFEEPDGTTALYAAGVSARVYIPGLPQPRILRSADGVTFAPIPLPDLEPILPLSILDLHAGFRSIIGYNGRLFVVATPGLRGDGWLIVSDDPRSGQFELVPLPDPAMRAYQMVVFNDQLYIGVAGGEGYEVWRTDAVGDPKDFHWTPVVIEGAGRGESILSVVSMHEFKGRLYIGANGFLSFPISAELIRVNPDDSWDVVAGRPRWYLGQYKRPISGLRDGMNNVFNVHFWRMGDKDGTLYVGTNDSSWRLRSIPLVDALFKDNYGFDLYKSTNGVNWTLVTQNGFGDPFAFGVRSFISDQTGLYLGTANHVNGTAVWRGTPDSTCPAGAITADPTILQLELVEGIPVLAWDAPANAANVRVYRAEHTMAADIVDIELIPADLQALAANASVPQGYRPLDTTAAPIFVDTTAEPGRNYSYYVQAEDTLGRPFEKSNFIAMPSELTVMTLAAISDRVAQMGAKIQSNDDVYRVVSEASHYIETGFSARAARVVERLRETLTTDGSSDPLAVEDVVDAIDQWLRRYAIVREGIMAAAALR